MPKLIFLKGLPASGKTTWAKKQIDANPKRRIHVTKDALRAMLNNSHHDQTLEKHINRIQDWLVEDGLARGLEVVCDNTHFHQPHEERMRALADKYGAEFEVKFFDVDVEECVKRDAKRDNPVGAKVIYGMYNKYLKKPAAREIGYMEQDRNLPHAYIFDIDSTCALINPENPRSPFDMKRVGEDLVNEPVWFLFNNLVYAAHTATPHPHFIFVSGRNECARKDTWEWLVRNNFIPKNEDKQPYFHLYMRADGDSRKDFVIKEEIYRNHIFNKYFIRFCCDDRDQVVNHMRSLGVPVFQVRPGDF